MVTSVTCLTNKNYLWLFIWNYISLIGLFHTWEKTQFYVKDYIWVSEIILNYVIHYLNICLLSLLF